MSWATRSIIFSSVSVSPAPPVDLRPARDARLDLVAQHVFQDLRPVLLVVRDGVRARPDDRHVAPQHVNELRQLVERRPPKSAPRRVTRGSVAARLAHARAVLGHAHRAKLPDEDLLAAAPVAALLEEDRARASSIERRARSPRRSASPRRRRRPRRGRRRARLAGPSIPSAACTTRSATSSCASDSARTRATRNRSSSRSNALLASQTARTSSATCRRWIGGILRSCSVAAARSNVAGSNAATCSSSQRGRRSSPRELREQAGHRPCARDRRSLRRRGPRPEARRPACAAGPRPAGGASSSDAGPSAGRRGARGSRAARARAAESSPLSLRGSPRARMRWAQPTLTR